MPLRVPYSGAATSIDAAFFVAAGRFFFFSFFLSCSCVDQVATLSSEPTMSSSAVFVLSSPFLFWMSRSVRQPCRGAFPCYDGVLFPWRFRPIECGESFLFRGSVYFLPAFRFGGNLFLEGSETAPAEPSRKLHAHMRAHTHTYIRIYT